MKSEKRVPWLLIAVAVMIVVSMAGCSSSARVKKMEKDLAVLNKIVASNLSSAKLVDNVIVVRYQKPVKIMTDSVNSKSAKSTSDTQEEPIKIPIPPDRRMGEADIYYFTDDNLSKSGQSRTGGIEVLRSSITEEGYFKIFEHMKKGEQYILIRFPDTFGTATGP